METYSNHQILLGRDCLINSVIQKDAQDGYVIEPALKVNIVQRGDRHMTRWVTVKLMNKSLYWEGVGKGEIHF